MRDLRGSDEPFEETVILGRVAALLLVNGLFSLMTLGSLLPVET